MFRRYRDGLSEEVYREIYYTPHLAETSVQKSANCSKLYRIGWLSPHFIWNSALFMAKSKDSSRWRLLCLWAKIFLFSPLKSPIYAVSISKVGMVPYWHNNTFEFFCQYVESERRRSQQNKYSNSNFKYTTVQICFVFAQRRERCASRSHCKKCHVFLRDGTISDFLKNWSQPFIFTRKAIMVPSISNHIGHMVLCTVHL